MTVQQPASAFQSDAHGEFVRLRSDFMDEFARLEIAVGRRLKRIHPEFDVRKFCFDRLVEKLAKEKPSHGLATESVATVASLPHDCEPFQQLRASMAHGVLEIATTNDGILAIFQNAADVIEGSDACYALTPAAFNRQIGRLAALRMRIEGLSPSLRPQLAPDEATGP